MRTAVPPASAPRARRGRPASQAQTRTFLRMVGHELRTPLNSILGFSEILAAELYGPLGAPQYRDYAEIINESGRKMLRLVDEVMELARLESGTIEWDLRREPLEPALDDALADLAEEASRHEIGIEVAGRERLPDVLADARGLRNVLSGVIRHAVVFSPPAATVRIRAARRGAAVDLVVESECGGQEMPRTLQPFAPAKTAPSRAGAGAALGLPICALTCEAMGGRLSVAAVKGRGLRARVKLRAA